MKICNVEIPADLEIPDLTAKEIADLEAIRDEMARDREEQAQRLAKSPFKDWKFEFAGTKTVDTLPMSINVEALRKLPPRLRAIVVYAYRDHITY
jgi:hypothetical protein